MATFDEVLEELLTPSIPLYACSYDGIAVDHYGKLSPHLLSYCYNHGLVRQSNGKAWRFYATIKAPDGTPAVKIWWGRNYPRMAPVRIRINPSTGGLSAGQYAALLALLSGSEVALEDMRIAQVDYKVDIETTVEDLDRHLIAAHARRRRKIMGMVVVNARQGAAQLVIYDVGAKRGMPPGQLSRLEYRKRFKVGKEKPLLWDFLMEAKHLEEGNLFDRLSLVNTDVLDGRTQQGRLVTTVGATGAYLRLQGTERRQYVRSITTPLPPGQATLADVFAHEAELWHETLDDMGHWLAIGSQFIAL